MTEHNKDQAGEPPIPPATDRCTAFTGHRQLAAGAVADVAIEVRRAGHADGHGVLVFDDTTGRVIDLDLRGDEADVAARYATPYATAPGDAPTEPQSDPKGEPRGPGRPRLGVVAREITLLPRHWAWLATQPGGASVAIRRLVEDARRTHADADRQRQAREAAYRVMHALGGDLPDYEEASRALFAGDRDRFHVHTAAWPPDVRAHVARLAFAIGT